MAIMKFDYIIVGAGSAGCVLATRLAEAGHKTLILEAGGGDNSRRGLFQCAFFNSSIILAKSDNSKTNYRSVCTSATDYTARGKH